MSVSASETSGPEPRGRIETIVVLGAGTMGRGIAQVAVRAGRSVHLVDAEASIVREARTEIAERLREREEAADVPLDRLTVGTDPAEACAAADLVVEAVPEQFALKANVLRTADEAAPEGALLASNTSSISITRLAAETGRPERVLGMHFFNPVPVMEGVELVEGLATEEAAMRRAESLVEELGKRPVRVNDSPGFVSNRVLMPMINESIYCVMEGVAEPKEVDAVMELGTAHPMGPLALADLIGLDVCLDVMEVLHEELGEDKYRPCPLLRRMVDAGRLGRKTGEGFYEY